MASITTVSSIFNETSPRKVISKGISPHLMTIHHDIQCLIMMHLDLQEMVSVVRSHRTLAQLVKIEKGDRFPIVMERQMKLRRELRSVDLKRYKSVSMASGEHVIEACPSLVKLTLSRDPNHSKSRIPEVLLLKIVLKALSSCSNLESLDLAYNDQLTSHSFSKFIPDCNRLKELNLKGCAAFSEDNFSSITRFCSHLRTFIFPEHLQVSYESMVHLAQNVTQLNKLKLSNCRKIEVLHVINFITNRPVITYLNVSNTKCGDELIYFLIRRGLGIHLQVLKLRNLSISIGLLDLLLKNCRKLKNLDLRGLDITEQIIETLAQYNTHLEKLRMTNFRVDVLTVDKLKLKYRNLNILIENFMVQ